MPKRPITLKFCQSSVYSEGNNHEIITLDLLQSNKASRRCLHGSSSSLKWFFKHSEGSRFCLTTQSLFSKHSLSASSSGSHTPPRVIASDMHRLRGKSVVLCPVCCLRSTYAPNTARMSNRAQTLSTTLLSERLHFSSRLLFPSFFCY